MNPKPRFYFHMMRYFTKFFLNTKYETKNVDAQLANLLGYVRTEKQ